MKKIINGIQKQNIMHWLFVCIIINLIPVIILEEFNVSNGFYSILVALGYFIQTVIMLVVTKDKAKEISKKEKRLFILFFGLQILGQMFNFMFLNSIHIKDLINLTATAINIFIFIIACNYFKVEKSQIKSFLEKMVILGVIASLYNIIKNGLEFTSLFTLQVSHSANFSSFFPNRNQFGIFLLVIILCNSYLISTNRTKSNVLIQILLIVSLLLTMSRNCIMGLIILYLFRLYFELKNKKIKKPSKKTIVLIVSIFILLITSLIILLNNDQTFETLNKLFFRIENLKNGSGRFELWHNSIRICLDNNVITGVGRFRALQINELVYNNDLNNFHNIYFETLVTYGVVGVGALLGLFIYIFKKNISNKDIKYKAFLITSMMTFLSISILETITRFSMGYVDTISLVMFFTLPIICSNMVDDSASENSNTEENMYKKYIKRLLDIVISILGIIISLPITLVIGLLIRFKLGKPIIFKSERPGKDGKIFTLYKFRSMSNKTDKNGELLPDEERLTKFGKLLRKTSLDEIPELWNIIKGDMSLVGPRPLDILYLPYYNEKEKHRHDVRPGLTGLAQVNGRNALNWEERFDYDIKYVNNITFINDLKIILKTIKKVFKSEDIVIRGKGKVIDFHEYRKKQLEKKQEK